jgi:SAM-dependent methyltransferase
MTSAFDGFPEFYAGDDVSDRSFRAVAKQQLEDRYRAIFSEWNLTGKTVLDLGSHLGTTGQWVLHHGVSHYTGVESQALFAERSRALLSHHRGKAEIIHAPIVRFLEANLERFDVVTLLGCRHRYLDYFSLLKAVAAVCNETLIIEGIYPAAAKTDPTAPIVEIAPSTGEIAASVDSNHDVISSRLSPSALGLILKTLDFEPAGAHSNPKRPSIPPDNFSGDGKRSDKGRFLATFRRSSTLCRGIDESLSGLHTSNASASRDAWPVQTEQYDEYEKRRLRNEQTTDIQRWTFNEKVAQNFSHEARTNIPDYDRVIDLTVSIARNFVPKNATIIDIGCALGETLRRLSEAGFTSLYGTDSSPDMLEQAHQSADRRSRYILTDTLPVRDGCAKLITANWVLHFIGHREALLRDIYRSLVVDGHFILTDRVLQSHETARLYRELKLAQGLAVDYIDYKEEALKGVLVSYPLDWYLVTLRRVGFRAIEIVNASLGFTTFLAKK